MRATRVFRARYRLPVRRIKVKNDLTAIVADEIGEGIELVLCWHDRKVDTAAFRRNTDIALAHKLNHAPAVIAAAVVIAQRVADVTVVDRAISAGASFVPAGEVKFLAVRQDVSGLRPLVGMPEILVRVLAVLLLLFIGVLFQ